MRRKGVGVVFLANGATSDVADVLASNAEVGKFAIGHAAEFGNGLAILDPVVVSARNVHRISLLIWPWSG